MMFLAAHLALVTALQLGSLGVVRAGKSGDGYFYGRATFYDDNQQ